MVTLERRFHNGLGLGLTAQHGDETVFDVRGSVGGDNYRVGIEYGTEDDLKVFGQVPITNEIFLEGGLATDNLGELRQMRRDGNGFDGLEETGYGFLKLGKSF